MELQHRAVHVEARDDRLHEAREPRVDGQRPQTGAVDEVHHDGDAREDMVAEAHPCEDPHHQHRFHHHESLQPRVVAEKSTERLLDCDVWVEGRHRTLRIQSLYHDHSLHPHPSMMARGEGSMGVRLWALDRCRRHRWGEDIDPYTWTLVVDAHRMVLRVEVAMHPRQPFSLARWI